MMNEIVIVGRLVDDFKLEEKDGKKYTQNTLAVSRSFKDKNGVYQTDFIPFYLFFNIAETATEYCHKGDIIGIKGQLQSYKNKLQMNVAKVTFFTTQKEKSDENLEIDKKF